MKRAAMVILAIASLVLLGSPSAPLFDHSSSYAATSKSTTGPSVVAPTGGTVDTGASAGGGGGSGGSNQGDGDGLSGLKVAPGGEPYGAGSELQRVTVLVQMWWKFMLWIR